mmetsp:Transcript_82470/g.163721  ORF Transcript_82470/g.163721 Transcript_82470/m.163721 type:complete len:96 (-) Transcript_82470:237-524(-)
MRVPDSGDVARAKMFSSSAASDTAILFHDIRADCATEAAGIVPPMAVALGLCGEEVPDIGGEGDGTLRHVEQGGEPVGGTQEPVLVPLSGAELLV